MRAILIGASVCLSLVVPQVIAEAQVLPTQPRQSSARILNDAQMAVRQAQGSMIGVANAATLEKIERSLSTLELFIIRPADDRPADEPGEVYLEALSLNAQAIAETGSADSASAEAAVALLEIVAEDLDLKIESLPALAGGPIGEEGFEIHVTVRTERPTGEDAPGYYVRANPRAQPDLQDPLVEFNNPTISTRRMPPGNWVMWIVDGEGRELGRRNVAIGRNFDSVIKFIIP